MARQVHDRVSLVTEDDRFRDVLVMVDADPEDEVSLEVSTLGMSHRVMLTLTQARALGALLTIAGEP